MARVYNRKHSGKESPCKPPQPCLDHDRDYDPCDTGPDITDEDLQELLRQEQERLRREKEREDAEQRRLRAEAGEAKDKAGDGEGGKAARGRPCNRGKRPPCRRVPEPNPFFTDRLGFSSDLPPPPPVPPPQFFPLVDGSETKVCPKKRKKCKKRSRGKSKEGEGDSTGRGGPSSEAVEECQTEEEECKCEYEGECLDVCPEERKIVKGRCKKRPKPPCRKKVSEVSISLQPRRIPALQRELPAMSPKEMPEVVRQILMSCENECSVDCGRRKCKKSDRCK